MNEREAPEPLWRYIEANRFEAPTAPTELPDRREILRLWRWLRPKREESDSASESLNPLPRLSRRLLDHLAPAPDEEAAVAALEAALAPRLEDGKSEGRPILVVGAPRSGAGRIVESWAEFRGRPAAPPPAPEQILDRDENWLAELKRRNRPWVLPRLEKCWLRHAEGFWLIQALLEMLAGDEAGGCVIGCDSWAWEFFGHLPPGLARIPQPLIARAWGADRLARWLGPAAASAGVVIRQTENDALVLPDFRAVGEDADGGGESGDFHRYLAAHARGVPAVIRAVWRRALENGGEAASRESEGAPVSAFREIRIPSWKELTLPSTATDIRAHSVVLHSLLLHDGLSGEMLSRLLPLSPAEIAGSLHRLRAAELVERKNGRWRVSAIGYPAARKLLLGEGYLTDFGGD